MVETQYVHKQQVRLLIKGVFDSFARQIRELERGAELHEDALEARLAWSVRLNESLDRLSAQVSQFEGMDAGLISETTRTFIATERSSSASASYSASSSTSSSASASSSASSSSE